MISVFLCNIGKNENCPGERLFDNINAISPRVTNNSFSHAGMNFENEHLMSRYYYSEIGNQNDFSNLVVLCKLTTLSNFFLCLKRKPNSRRHKIYKIIKLAGVGESQTFGCWGAALKQYV